MVILTEREQLKAVANRWKSQYFRVGQGWGSLGRDESSEAIYKALAALPPTAAAADVERIIGNNTWVGYDCHECGEHVSVALEIGEPESHTVRLCLSCVETLATKAKDLCRAPLHPCPSGREDVSA